jgi:hypothetical protein
MGNSQSNKLEKKSKNTDLLYETYPIYDIIGPSGGGKLVDLMKLALKSNDFRSVDEFIKKEVAPFLINNGEGQMVCEKLHFVLKI